MVAGIVASFVGGIAVGVWGCYCGAHLWFVWESRRRERQGGGR